MPEKTSEGEWERKMRTLCEAHRWTLLEDDLDAPSSPFIRRIIDAEGHPHILKVRASEPYKKREFESMLAMRASRCVPKITIISETGPVFLIKDLGGLPLNVAMQADDSFLWRSAKMVRRLHHLPVPDWAMPIADFIAMRHPPHERQHGEVQRRANSVLERLLSGPMEDCFLHGDFHPRNVVVSKGKLWTIDPFGLRGDRAYDIAVMAAHTSDPIRAALRLAKRYEEPLPRLNLWLAWACYNAYEHLSRRGTREDIMPCVKALRLLTAGR